MNSSLCRAEKFAVAHCDSLCSSCRRENTCSICAWRSLPPPEVVLAQLQGSDFRAPCSVMQQFIFLVKRSPFLKSSEVERMCFKIMWAPIFMFSFMKLWQQSTVYSFHHWMWKCNSFSSSSGSTHWPSDTYYDLAILSFKLPQNNTAYFSVRHSIILIITVLWKKNALSIM